MQFTVDKTSGAHGQVTISVTPKAWTGRLATLDKIVGIADDTPNPEFVLTANMAGLGDKVVEQAVKINGVSKAVNAVTGIAENATFTKDVNDVVFSGKSNLREFAISGVPVDSTQLTVKIDPLGGTSYKYLKSDGSLSTTPVTIPWSGMVGFTVPIAGDPGATGYYSFEISGIKVRANSLAENAYVEIAAMGVVNGAKIGVSGTQAGASPTISFDKSVLNFTPGNLSAQTFMLTSNDDWKIVIRES